MPLPLPPPKRGGPHSLPPSPQAGPRLEGLRGRTPGCTWDSLRNSAGEKIVQLRSHPLAAMGAGACALLQELSEEQRFAISYLDIGEPPPPQPCPSSGLSDPNPPPAAAPTLG